jgi:hypothetical protein
VLFFGAPAEIFDFDSFSFHVHFSASLSANALTAIRQNASINRLVLVFMLPPLRKIVDWWTARILVPKKELCNSNSDRGVTSDVHDGKVMRIAISVRCHSERNRMIRNGKLF